MVTNTDHIREYLGRLFVEHTSRGHEQVRVISGDIHKDIRFNQGTHPNQMPSVCNVMHEFLQSKDRVISETKSGKSSTLTIDYLLPR